LSERQRLSNRRRNVSFELECAGLRYTATISQFSDGQLAEIFLANHKAGSQAGANARDSAVVCSLALQFGVPLDVIRRALLRNSDGTAASPLGAALDLIGNGER
jgi:hypothetical protein